MVTIRPVNEADLDALYAISLATSDRGRDAGHLYEDPRLVGHIYAAPYAVLEPGLAFVAEDAAGVGGFVLGVTDTDAWRARLEKEWWPALRKTYRDPAEVPLDRRNPDQRRAAMIHHPEAPPPDVTGAFPAHLHMNLMPRLQGRGVGTTMLNRWLAAASARGAASVHVGVNKENAGGVRFWSRRRFAAINLPANTGSRSVWMGRQINLERLLKGQSCPGMWK